MLNELHLSNGDIIIVSVWIVQKINFLGREFYDSYRIKIVHQNWTKL